MPPARPPEGARPPDGILSSQIGDGRTELPTLPRHMLNDHTMRRGTRTTANVVLSLQLPLKRRRRRRIRSLGRRRDRQLPLFGVAYYSCSIQSHAIQFIHPSTHPSRALFEARMRARKQQLP